VLGAPSESSINISDDPRIRVADAPATDNLQGERKTVTALFADIKGSTELEQDLDPEEARAIIDPALKLMIEAVRRYDGYIVQSTGDGIFALFGAPVAHEDHPQRALYAALRMQEEIRRYAERLRADGRAPIQIRVGVNTGEVVVRSIATGDGHVEHTPIGHTTNLASRMQTLADPGATVISEGTRRLAEGYFALKPLGPARIKGVTEPVTVYEVTGLGPLRTRLQRSAGRGLTKFVGREREMEAMLAAADRAKAGRGQLVAAMAEAGTGKSRLFFEFKAKNQSGWMVLETFSVSHGKASAYFPVIDLLHTYFKIIGDDDERSRRAKVIGAVLALDRSLEDTLPYLFGLLGIVEGDDPLAQMDAQVRKRRTLDAIKRILLRESLNQPLMVIFEDLHWIDEETQAFLNLLADSIGTAKILLLVNYRPEYSHQWNSKTYYTQLRLDPLGKESADEMLSALLFQSPLPPGEGQGEGADISALKRLIIEKTEGNPFFMEETVQVLLDEGALVREQSRAGTPAPPVRLTKALGELKIPPTVQGILAARIDRLAPDAKDLLQTLAVIGREFPLSLIRAVVPKSDDELSRMLNDLQLGEFIYEQPAVGDTEYIFKHALTQEVAYNSVLIEWRKQLHERIGAALETLYSNSLDDHLDGLAHHHGRGNNPVKAVEYLGRACVQAAQRSAYAKAISRLTAAIDLLQRLPDSPERTRQELLLQLAVGPAATALKGFAAPEAERAYTRARALCERLRNPPALFPTMLFTVRSARGESRKAYEIAEQLLRQAQGAGDPALLLRASWAMGVALYFLAELPAARGHLELALSTRVADDAQLSFFPGLDNLDFKVWLLQYAAWTLWQLGYPDRALKQANEGLALARGMSHPFSLAVADLTVGVVHQYRREAGMAQATAERSIGFCTERGITDYLAWAIGLCGWAKFAQGDRQRGIGQIQQGLEASRATGTEAFRPYFLCLLGEACMETGRFDDGLRALTEALALVDQLESRFYEAEVHRLKGELLLGQNGSSAAQAQNCFERAIEIARKQSAKLWELRATTSLARLLRDTQRRDEARAMLAEIYNWFTEGFDTADLKDAKALLGELNN